MHGQEIQGGRYMHRHHRTQIPLPSPPPPPPPLPSLRLLFLFFLLLLLIFTPQALALALALALVHGVQLLGQAPVQRRQARQQEAELLQSSEREIERQKHIRAEG